ncbi:MAG: RdgB/HAM1 family non-canonical purine NTP pyrophosphatase [Planctomycetes bacterium]|nr:RdgB/HAM1 family non-canonical purine NTP pyrophosphatase [Planctomycetota bacterium]
MELLLATSNPHKMNEIAAVMGPRGVHIIGLDTLHERPPEPVEGGNTFAENARIKAVHYAKATGRLCLADDSGLEVDALGGEPGVHSARYAGASGTRAERDAANNANLLAQLRGVPTGRRTARFVCALCLADKNGTVIAETRGAFDGVIADAPRGSNGFGYDPLLYLPDVACTSAQLTPQQKNARSHRGEAARKMAERIAQLRSVGSLGVPQNSRTHARPDPS